MDRPALPSRWWWNPTPEITAELNRQRRQAFLDYLCEDPARGNAYLDRLSQREGEAAARKLREELRAHWRQRKTNLAGQEVAPS